VPPIAAPKKLRIFLESIGGNGGNGGTRGPPVGGGGM